MRQIWWKWPLTWQGRVSRAEYLLSGTILALVKYVVDRSVALRFGQDWPVWTYVLTPLQGILRLGTTKPGLPLTLGVIAIPFFWVGIALTLRRLQDAGKHRVWVFLLFAPFANLALFLWMVLAPSEAAGESGSESTGDEEQSNSTSWRVGVGIAIAAVLGLAIALLATERLADYGIGLFLGIPFLVGFIASWFLNLLSPRSAMLTVGVSIAPIVLIGLGFLGMMREGLICLLMAAPIALPFAIAGGLAARDILRSRREAKGRPITACIAAIPMIILAEYGAQLEPPVAPVTTSIVIDAPAPVVWKNVISFPPLDPPSLKSSRDWVFAAGIAYPMSGRIVGSGVGAVRYCHFSTGEFVEPITVWDENHLLAFDVAAEPPALHELSPWEIDPPHLERNYMRSRHGQFRLTALNDHQTLLEGTTWYQDYFWPQAYWRGWSDEIVHRIHMRVLEHVKRQAEKR